MQAVAILKHARLSPHNARLLADQTHLALVQISAIFSGVPELRKVFETARIRRANGQGRAANLQFSQGD